MTGHRPFSDLTKDWSAERRARSDARQAEMTIESIDSAAMKDGELCDAATSAERDQAVGDDPPLVA
ncbi:hypothetical protein [Sphingomonas sp. PWP1-2]|uniref:hypothetical protein n=1 Tax=Sphingomonas sp. PWP1-2 TaxID=2804558 RepID=UPI003CF41360